MGLLDILNGMQNGPRGQRQPSSVEQTGLGREDLLAGLSQHLPDLIDQLTPNGRLPSEEEAHRMV